MDGHSLRSVSVLGRLDHAIDRFYNLSFFDNRNSELARCVLHRGRFEIEGDEVRVLHGISLGYLLLDGF